MKLNKTFGRIATTLVATAMLASVAAVPAFADKFGTDGVIDNTTTHTEVTEIEFTKELLKPATVNTPNKTFTFTLKNADVDENATYTSSGKVLNLYDGVGASGDGITASANFTASMGVGEAEDGENVNTVSTTVKFNISSFAAQFTDAGVYKYDITEATESAPYYNGDNLDLYLFVERYTEGDNEKYKVTGAVLTVDGQVNEKTDSTTNGYMVDPDDPENPDTNDLTITKTVEGAMGSHGEEFNFTVTLPGSTEDIYNAQYEKDETTTPVTLHGGPNNNIKLSDDMTLRIYGLVDDTSTYIVKEDDYAEQGYETEINGQKRENNTLSATYNAENNAVSVVNTRNAVSPTGLVMDIAPYALLVVVAAAGCFVFLRKRRED